MTDKNASTLLAKALAKLLELEELRLIGGAVRHADKYEQPLRDLHDVVCLVTEAQVALQNYGAALQAYRDLGVAKPFQPGFQPETRGRAQCGRFIAYATGTRQCELEKGHAGDCYAAEVAGLFR